MAAAKTADVIVIGGGVNGTSIAFNLARRGVEVTLLEKKAIAAGPTGRSCGIIRQHYSHEVTARMARRALEIFQNFGDVVGGHCDFVQTGFLIASGENHFATLEANVALQQSVGIDTRVISVEELRELEPHVDTEGIVGGAYEPGSGYADPYSTSNAFAERAAELGAEILTGVHVESVVVEGERACGVETSEGRIDAGAVVVAAGPWSPLLARHVGVELPITPCRVQVCLFNRTPEIDNHHVFVDSLTGVYVRPEGEDLMLVGSIETKEAEASVDDPDDYSESVDFDRVAHYSEKLAYRYPAMRSGGSFLNGYASLYDVTPDWQPILDRLPGVDGLYCCCGSSGHGFKLAPVVGEMMADLIIGGKEADDAISMFSFERFAAGMGQDGKYPHKILG